MEKNFSKDSKITVILMVICATASYELFLYIYRGIVLDSNMEVFAFFRILAIEVLYNALLTIILYPLMQKIGYKIQDTFKSTQILTRYF